MATFRWWIIYQMCFYSMIFYSMMKTHIITYHILLLWLPIYVLSTVYLLSIIHRINLLCLCLLLHLFYYLLPLRLSICNLLSKSLWVYDYLWPIIYYCLLLWLSTIIIYIIIYYYKLSMWLLSIIYESMIICDLFYLWLSTITMHLRLKN